MVKNISKYKEILIKITVILFVCLMCFLIFIKFKSDTNMEKKVEAQKADFFETIDKNNIVNVSNYTVYGTHFNIEGTLDIVKVSGISIDSINLVVKNLNNKELGIRANFNHTDNTISFSTSDKINEGIDLEDLSVDTYFILIKIAYSNGDIKYYSLNNSSEYNNLSYYTITKNSSNNKIDIAFDKYNDIPYMFFNVSSVEALPDDVYDIAIDPGHGGSDNGAISGEYKESELVVKYGLILKSKLEDLGLKVFISRNGTESSKENLTSTAYNENGKINILNKSHAKILISLHMDNDLYSKNDGGVEVYAPNDCNLDFATLLAKNIVDNSNTYYSKLNSFKKADGVYIRNFTNADILAYKNKAVKGGYEPYTITTSTPYLYTIRETGGISTHAFIDGRNTNYGTNIFVKSNIGTESYQIQLGYINIKKDLDNILANYEKYMEAIAQTINTYYILNQL